MKRIGVITIHNSPNYGATLQSFALWKYLSEQGYDVEVIDLYRPYQIEYIPSKKFKSCRRESCFKLIKSYIKKFFFVHQSVNLLSDEVVCKFRKFNSQIKLSKPFYGPDELYEHPPIYDIYITGSDQVWNPTQPYCVEPYFLTFVGNSGKKISYAASIGISSLSETEEQKYKQWLESYIKISV